MRQPHARLVAEPLATLCGVAKTPAALRGGYFAPESFAPPSRLSGNLRREGMLRLRRRRSPLLAPALLIDRSRAGGRDVVYFDIAS